MAYRSLKCKRCGYKWYPYVDSPKQCPNCRSRDWMKPRQRPPRKKRTEVQ